MDFSDTLNCRTLTFGLIDATCVCHSFVIFFIVRADRTHLCTGNSNTLYIIHTNIVKQTQTYSKNCQINCLNHLNAPANSWTV